VVGRPPSRRDETCAPPDWLIEKLAVRTTNSSNSAPVPSAEWQKLVTGPITEYRDMAAARIAGHLFRRWVDIDVVVSLMRGWNVMHCVPPLTDGELISILNRIADREATRLERETRGWKAMATAWSTSTKLAARGPAV
jgi:hypothetical protein